MRISDMRIREISVLRVYDTYIAGLGRLQSTTSRGLSRYQIIELFTDGGLVGLGEVSDISDRMQVLSADGLRDLLAQVLVGADVRHWRKLCEQVTEILPATFHPELRGLVLFGVEIALLDLIGKAYGAPLYELLGGRYHDKVDVSWVAYLRGDISLDEELKMLADEIEEKTEKGFRAFKLKVGEDHPKDLTRIRLVRKIAGPDAYLKVDTSGAWEETEAIRKIRDMAEAGANACETPVIAVNRSIASDHPQQINRNADEAALSLARVRTASPIAIIEHVSDLGDVFAAALVRHRAVDVVNVVPSQGGGLLRAQRLIHLAETAGIPALLGSTIEMGPGTAAFVHLAVACKNVTVPSDLVGPELLVDDICTTPFRFEQGALRPFEKPGLGVELDEARMERWAV